MLTYPLDDRKGESLYRYLYRCIKNDIVEGVISPGDRLPSKRALAKHLGISLVTVEGAYTQLIAEGYVRSEQRRGYFANVLALAPAGRGKKAEHHLREEEAAFAFAPTPAPQTASEACAFPLIADLSGGSVASELFPSAAWAKTVRDLLSRESKHALLREPPQMGTMRLREAIASHLRAFRGLEVRPSQIVVGSGAQTLYGFIVQLLGRDRRFAVEDPGYPRLARIYESNDVRLSHVPLDSHGIDMAALRASQVDVVHLMPSHQFPTGLVTPISRRYELLGWASDGSGRYLVEDDYDCEFRLAGTPIPTMMGIDADERVVYANTFSRSLGRAFRVAYLVLPPHLTERFQSDLGFYSCTVSTMEQLALARFIESGDFERHINRMRGYCRAARSELVKALAASPLAARATIEGAEAGLHFLLRIDTPASETALAAAARREGVALLPLTSFRRHSASGSETGGAAGRPWPGGSCSAPAEKQGSGPCRFLVSYAGLSRPAIAPVVEALARAVSSAARCCEG